MLFLSPYFVRPLFASSTRIMPEAVSLTPTQEISHFMQQICARPWLRLLALCAFTILLFKIPYFFHRTISEPVFLTRYVPMIVINSLVLYGFMASPRVQIHKLLQYVQILAVLLALSAFLPATPSPLTHIADLSLGLLMWFLWLLTHNDFEYANTQKRIQFIRINLIVLFLSCVFMGVLFALVGGLMGMLSAHKIYFLQYCFKDVIRSNAVLIPLFSLHIVHLRRRAYTFEKLRNVFDVIVPTALFALTLILCAFLVFHIPLRGANVLTKLSILSFISTALLLAGTSLLSSRKEIDRATYMIFLLPLGVLGGIFNVMTIDACARFLYNTSDLSDIYPWVIGFVNSLLFVHTLLMLRALARVYFYRKHIAYAQKTAVRYMNVYAISVLALLLGALCYQLFFITARRFLIVFN